MTQPYLRQAHYHETDQMGIIHHANYIRWFEEARIAFLRQIGFPYETLEEAGIYIPVLDVTAKYQQMVRFGDSVQIFVSLARCSPVKMTITYEIWNEEKTTLYTSGQSQHCFLNSAYQPVSLKKAFPDLYTVLQSYLEA